jgi:hypothetical protein
MDEVARVIHLEVSFSSAVPAAEISTIKDLLHEEAKKLTEKIAAKDKSIMSLIAVADEKSNHLVRHLT